MAPASGHRREPHPGTPGAFLSSNRNAYGRDTFYRQAEGWSLLDSLYFSVITLTTVGYGDLSPSTGASKIFTIFYIFVGIGIILGFVNAIAERSLQNPGVFSRLLHHRDEKDKERD